MKLAYLSDANIPSKRANSVHVMKICEAFAENGCEVNLYGLDHQTELKKDIWEWYGVKPFGLDLHGFRIPKLRLWIHAFATAFKLRKYQPDVIFGRSLFSCYLAARMGFKVAYETHDPVSVMSGQQANVFKRLIKHKNLTTLVVLSNALKNIILDETGPVLESKIHC